MLRQLRSRPVRRALGLPIAAGAVIGLAGPVAPHAATPPGWDIIRVLPATDTSLDAITALSGGDAWAGGATSAQTPVLYRLAASGWRAVPLPGAKGSAVIDVSASSASDVWAAIDSAPEGLAARLTSRGWLTYSFPQGADQIQVTGVVTTGPADTWVFTYNRAARRAYGYHYAGGSAWSRTLLPADVAADGAAGLVSGSSATNIWALTILHGRDESLRYNGTRWLVHDFPGHLVPAGTFAGARQILAESPRNVWATMIASSGRGAGPVVLLHWNGLRWGKVPGRLPTGSLAGPIAADGSGGLWLAALNRTGSASRLLRYAHGHWASYAVPAGPNLAASINGLALIPRSRLALAVMTLGSSSGTARAAVAGFGA